MSKRLLEQLPQFAMVGERHAVQILEVSESRHKIGLPRRKIDILANQSLPTANNSLTASQPHSLTASQPHSLTASQPHSLTASQPHSLTASQPHSRKKALRQNSSPVRRINSPSQYHPIFGDNQIAISSQSLANEQPYSKPIRLIWPIFLRRFISRRINQPNALNRIRYSYPCRKSRCSSIFIA